jgi:hypothetical protein
VFLFFERGLVGEREEARALNCQKRKRTPRSKRILESKEIRSRKRKGLFWFSDFFILACLEDCFIGGKKMLFSGGVEIAFGSSLCLDGY